MELWWQGVNITQQVNITGCVARESACGKSDALELTLDNASAWYRWGPKEDDEIVVTEGTYSTGTMFLNAVLPEGDRYRVLATSLRSLAGRKRWQSYQDTTLGELFGNCASECGMEGRLYGIDGGLPYTYVIRHNEGCAAFLNRLGGMEGLAVRVYDGSIQGIALNYAQEREPVFAMEIAYDQPGVTYRRRESVRYTSITVQAAGFSAIARDTEATGDKAAVITHLPARSASQAGRWARGLLTMNNRRAEELTLDTTLNTALTTLNRVDVTGSTDMAGQWIVDEAEHDLFNERTRATLRRVLQSVR